MALPLYNQAEGGTDTTTVSTANSGAGSGNAWDTVTIGGTAAITFDNDHAYGSLAYKVVGSGSGDAFLIWSTSMGTVGEVWGRFYLYLTALPPGNLNIKRFRNAGSQAARMTIDTAGHVELRQASNSLLVETVAAVAVNQWVRIEYHLIPLATNGTFEARLFNNPDSTTPTESISNTTAPLLTNITEIQLGQLSIASPATFWLDHIAVNATGWPGPAITTVAVGQASETDTADTVTPAHVMAVGQAAETDTAHDVTPASGAMVVAVAQASETDTADTVTWTHIVTVGQASETDTGQTVTVALVVTVGQASETDTADAVLPAGAPLTVVVAQAVEAHTAATITVRRTSMGYGIVSLERISLRETFTVNEQSAPRRITLSGQEASPPLDRDEVVRRHDQILGLRTASVAQLTMSDKPERNGYYRVRKSDADLTEYLGEMVTTAWSIELDRVGGDGETDLESRLTGIARANDFALTGERWHAPAIGHYAYLLGSTIPSSMTRATVDGDITVYRSLPSGALAPRWGCAPASYPLGRVRIASDGLERTGVDVRITPTDWELSNALTRVTPSGGAVLVDVWDGTQWESKSWTIRVGSTAVSIWDSVTILRNDYEQCVVRLTSNRAPGRVSLDLTLRRGSRFVEAYVQRGDSGTLSVARTTPETLTDNSSAGYVVATSNDAAGNKVIAGSARSFTAHADGGVSKTSTTKLDVFLGAVVGGTSAVSGDTAIDVRNQYIACLAEATAAVGR